MDSEERARAPFSFEGNLSPKILKQLRKQQIILTTIQYVISFIILILGICLYNFLDNIHFKIGTITIKDVEIQQIDINIAAVLILLSLYMIAKVTINLNIKINRGENK